MQEWKNRQIIIFGLDVLSKTIVSLFDFNQICNVVIVDNGKFGGVWGGKAIKKPYDVISSIIDIGNLAIIVTPQKSHTAIINEILDINPYLKKYILDLSYIRMDTMPNIIRPSTDLPIASLRECQLEMLDVLLEFTQICEKNHLRYFLDYGTLLGAVRHKGFIPWDDDLDVAMPMPDYLKFCEIYAETKNTKMFFDSVYNTKMGGLPISTLSKLKSRKIFSEFDSFPLRYMTGIALDIFPLCGYPSTLECQIDYLNEFYRLADIWKEKIVIPFGTNYYSEAVHKEILQQMDEVSMRYDYESSDFIGPAYFGFDNFLADDGRAMPKEWYENTVQLEFEGHMFHVPFNYDKVLKKWYGDYLKLPPVEERLPHASKELYRVKEFKKYE